MVKKSLISRMGPPALMVLSGILSGYVYYTGGSPLAAFALGMAVGALPCMILFELAMDGWSKAIDSWVESTIAFESMLKEVIDKDSYHYIAPSARYRPLDPLN